MEENSALGIFGPNCEKYPSVFQAEVLAIDFCAKSIVENGIIGANIYILSDSQAALKALQRVSGLKNRRGMQKFSTSTCLAEQSHINVGTRTLRHWQIRIY